MTASVSHIASRYVKLCYVNNYPFQALVDHQLYLQNPFVSVISLCVSLSTRLSVRSASLSISLTTQGAVQYSALSFSLPLLIATSLHLIFRVLFCVLIAMLDSTGRFPEARQSGPAPSSSSNSSSFSTASDEEANEKTKKGDEESSPSSPRFGLYVHSRPLGPLGDANGVRTYNRLIVRTDYTVYFSGSRLMVELPYRPSLTAGDSVGETESSAFRSGAVSPTELDLASSSSLSRVQMNQPAIMKKSDKTIGLLVVVDGDSSSSSNSNRAGITLGDDINDVKGGVGGIEITPLNTSASDPLIASPPAAAVVAEVARVRTRTRTRRLSVALGGGGGDEVIGGLRRAQSMEKEGEKEGRVRGRGGGGSRGRGRKRAMNDRDEQYKDKVHGTSTDGQYRRTDSHTFPLSDPYSFHRGGEGMNEREAKRAHHGRHALEGEYSLVEVPIAVAAVMHFRSQHLSLPPICLSFFCFTHYVTPS